MMAEAATTCCCCPSTTCLICSINPCISSDFLEPGRACEAGAAPGAAVGEAVALDRIPAELRDLMAGQMPVMRSLKERGGAGSGPGSPIGAGVSGTCDGEPSSPGLSTGAAW